MMNGTPVQKQPQLIIYILLYVIEMRTGFTLRTIDLNSLFSFLHPSLSPWFPTYLSMTFLPFFTSFLLLSFSLSHVIT